MLAIADLHQFLGIPKRSKPDELLRCSRAQWQNEARPESEQKQRSNTNGDEDAKRDPFEILESSDMDGRLPC